MGLSEWTGEQIREAAALADGLGVQLIYHMPQYSALWRVPETEVVPVCEPLGISQVPYFSLAQGVLTGKYAPGVPPPAGSRAETGLVGGRAAFMRRMLKDEVLARVALLDSLSREAGMTTPQLALAWLLHRPNVAGTVVGASRPEQVRENAAASGAELDAGLIARVDEILRPVAVHSSTE